MDEYYQRKAKKHGLSFSLITMFVAILLFGTFVAFAAEENKTFTFIPPTECENGDAIGSSEVCGELEQYRLSCSNSAGAPYETQDFFDPPADNTYSQAFNPGTYFCVLAVKHTLNEKYSAWSNEVNFTIAQPPTVPNPVTGFAVSDGS